MLPLGARIFRGGHACPCRRSQQLAERIAAFRYQDLPADLVAHAKLYLLDTLGAMLVASAPEYPASRIIMRFVNELGGVAESSLVGQGRKTSCVNAALANGTLGYYCDIEPHHVGAILHGPAVVVPTSLAVGEKQRADGKRVLASIVLGVEVAARVSYALRSRGALRPRLSSERGMRRLRRGGRRRLPVPAEPRASGGRARPRDAAGVGPARMGQ